MSKLNLSDEELLIALESHFKSPDFDLLKWNVISFNEEGKLGYLGDHYRVETTVQRGGGQENVSFFVKTTPANEVQRDLVEKSCMFSKEFLFYKLLADKMISVLSKTRPFVTGSKVSVIPRCHFARNDLLLLEDLHALGFQGIDADTPLTLDLFVMSMRALARYHAASIAWEAEEGKPLLDEFPGLDFESYLDDSSDFCFAPLHAVTLQAARELIPMVGKYKDKPEIVKKMQDALPRLFKELLSTVRPYPHTKNVFCHGDLWINNILFRLDKAGKPLEAILVDFQISRYAPPATDIMIFLFFSSNKEFRDKNTDFLLRAYYNELSKTLLDLDVHINEMLPWEELVRTIKEYHRHALFVMVMEYPCALAPSKWMDPILNDSEKYYQHFLVNRIPFCIKLFQENEKFRTRYEEVVEEIIDSYIIN